MPSSRSTPDPRRRLSPPALTRYRTCPRSFRLAYIDKVTTAPASRANFAQANAVHAALRRFLGAAPERRTTELLHRLLRSEWRTHAPLGTFASREEEAGAGRAALALLDRFAASFDLTARPVAREQLVAARLHNGLDVYGRVDRVDPFQHRPSRRCRCWTTRPATPCSTGSSWPTNRRRRCTC